MSDSLLVFGDEFADDTGFLFRPVPRPDGEQAVRDGGLQRVACDIRPADGLAGQVALGVRVGLLLTRRKG